MIAPSAAWAAAATRLLGSSYPFATARMSDVVIDAAVRVLILQNTVARARVESDRVDEVAAGSMPRLIVYATDDYAGESRGGTAPRFQVTATVIVQCLVEHAQQRDAQGMLRTLIFQAMDALLCDPDWVQLTENVASVRVVRTYKAEGERIVGDGRIAFTATWRETWPPRVADKLTKVDLTSAVQPGGAETEILIAVPQ